MVLVDNQYTHSEQYALIQVVAQDTSKMDKIERRR